MESRPPRLRASRFIFACLLASATLLAAPLQATTVVPPDFEQLVNESDYVARAVVESVRSEYRDGPQGRLIYTRVRFALREPVVGSTFAKFELEMLGGQIGDDCLIVTGAPVFHVGDEDFLFVRDNGRTITPLVAMMHGRYPVRRDASGREFVTRNNDVPLQDVAEIALPLATGEAAALQRKSVKTADALTPAQFTAQIRATRRPDYVRQNLR